MIWAIWRERGNYGISPVIILWSRRRLKAHLIVKSNSIIKIIVNCVSNLHTAAEEKRRPTDTDTHQKGSGRRVDNQRTETSECQWEHSRVLPLTGVRSFVQVDGTKKERAKDKSWTGWWENGAISLSYANILWWFYDWLHFYMSYSWTSTSTSVYICCGAA